MRTVRRLALIFIAAVVLRPIVLGQAQQKPATLDDLVAEVRLNNQRRRFAHFDVSGEARYMSDRALDGLLTQTELEALGVDILYTGLHESTGKRIGVDRDEDGGLDGDEASLGSSESNPNDNAFVGTSIPGTVDALHTSTTIAGGRARVPCRTCRAAESTTPRSRRAARSGPRRFSSSGSSSTSRAAGPSSSFVPCARPSACSISWRG